MKIIKKNFCLLSGILVCLGFAHAASADLDLPPLPDLPKQPTAKLGDESISSDNTQQTETDNNDAKFEATDGDISGDIPALPDMPSNEIPSTPDTSNQISHDEPLNTPPNHANDPQVSMEPVDPDFMSEYETPSDIAPQPDISSHNEILGAETEIKNTEPPVQNKNEAPKPTPSNKGETTKTDTKEPVNTPSDVGLRKQILPDNIYKKEYNEANSHLPHARYEEEYDALFFAASARNDINALRAFLDSGKNPNMQNKSGNTPLMVAVSKRKIDAVKLLLARGADPEIQNDEGITALHIAAFNGSADIINTLVNNKADLNAPNKNGNTPLILAVMSGSLRSVFILINNGADVNIQNKSGFAALHIAARSGRTDIIQALLENKADPRLKTKEGFDVIKLAEAVGKTEVADYLTNTWAVADVSKNNEYLLKTLDLLATNQTLEEEWYKNAAESVDFALLPDKQKKPWNEMLSGWMNADYNFSKLSPEEKRIWNEKRKVLQIIFKKHFTADSPQNQVILDSYMKKWEDIGKQPHVADKGDFIINEENQTQKPTDNTEKAPVPTPANTEEAKDILKNILKEMPQTDKIGADKTSPNETLDKTSIDDIKMPELTLPDIEQKAPAKSKTENARKNIEAAKKVEDANMPEIPAMPEMEMPEMEMPEIEMPEINSHEELSSPEIKTPEVGQPEPEITVAPDIKEATSDKISTPEQSLSNEPVEKLPEAVINDGLPLLPDEVDNSENNDDFPPLPDITTSPKANDAQLEIPQIPSQIPILEKTQDDIKQEVNKLQESTENTDVNKLEEKNSLSLPDIQNIEQKLEEAASPEVERAKTTIPSSLREDTKPMTGLYLQTPQHKSKPAAPTQM